MADDARPSSPSALARQADVQLIADLIFDAALEPASQKTYDSYVKGYSSFCGRHALQPFPASHISLQLYAAYWVATGRAHTTLPAILSAIKSVHRRNMWEWLTLSQQAFMNHFMKGVRKAFPHQPTRKQPMTQHIIDQLAALADFTNSNEVQFITMAYVAHDALLRACELLALSLSDVSWFSDHVRLRIRNSKANKLSATPEYIYLYDRPGSLSGFSTLRAYWHRMRFNTATNPHSPLFPAADLLSHLPKQAWVNYIHGLLARLDIDPSLYSGHSFRSGGATDLWTAGARPRAIQLHGRWLSDAFWLHIRDNPTATGLEISHAFSRLSSLTP